MLWRAWRLRAAHGAALLGFLAVFAAALLATGALRQARASSPEPLLPNLVADPPDGTAIATYSGEGSTRLLLRFNGYLHNVGPGALDFRGERLAPKVKGMSEAEVDEAVERYAAEQRSKPEHEQEDLPPGLEEELASPKMNLIQRLYTTNERHPSNVQEYLDRYHLNESSKGEMFYVNADGHHHWHLQRVAKYSLWNAAKSAEVAPAQKVGFCLEDSEHVEPSVGPEFQIYGESTGRAFCQQFHPNATHVFEGISPGWRDYYGSYLALQWVDISNVAPGQYWLREDIDPTEVIKEVESTGPRKHEYASRPTVVPGYEALAQTVAASGAQQKITLGAKSYQGEKADEKLSGPAEYSIVRSPAHGTLSSISGDTVTYTPTGNYSGPDSFTFAARDSGSGFPIDPVVATVSIQGETPSLAISGAQAEVTAGTSLTLTAAVAHDAGGVEWESTAGTVSEEGSEELTGIFHAPSQAGTVVVTAHLRDDPEVSAQLTVKVDPVPAPTPAPEMPSLGGTLGSKSTALSVGVSRPRAMLFGRKLVMTTTPTAAGLVRLSAWHGKRLLGTCATRTPAGRTFTCRLTLGPRISLRSRIGVVASLRDGARVLVSRLPAERIPEMRMRPAGLSGHAASARGLYWCGPSTLVPVLEGGSE